MKILDTKRTIRETPLSTLLCKLLALLILMLGIIFAALALRTFLTAMFTGLLSDVGIKNSKLIFNTLLPSIIADVALATACCFAADRVSSEPRWLVDFVARSKPSPDA